jgi:DNA polymerase II small subunit
MSFNLDNRSYSIKQKGKEKKPENRDFMVIDRVPDIFHAGHIHVMGYCNHRGVLIVNSGGWQDQTDYMAKLGLVPTPGQVPVVNLQTLETTVLSFV